MVRMTRVSAFRVISASERWGSFRLAPLTLVVLGLLQPHVASAEDLLPQGNTVVNGNVTVSTPTTGRMILNQSSDRAIVNWDSFSIGRGNSVDIQQPGTSSAILNRVTGETTSQIHGRLTATGNVFIVNPNGLFIGKQGEVQAGGGFVGSTLDTQDDDFMAGRLRFEGLGSSARVENAGRVMIGRGGFAALLGGQVSNSGLIMVPLGRVGLGAGERVTLDVSGDRFLQVEIPSEGGDEMRALIENSGTVSAEGGLIEMQAATARHAARHAINLSGVAEARSVSVHNGTIVLGGGAGGRVTVSGHATTRAKAPSRPAIIVERSARPAARPSGGDITITGREISLTGGRIDASGDAGGGIIRIGGDFRGWGVLPGALYLGVDAESVITADAGVSGDGGRVILWSDVRTEFSGNISARGGETSGDGGFVEVSGKEQLAFAGMVDTRAPMGAAGTLLLDPFNVFIEDVDVSDGGGFEVGTFTPNANDAIVSVALLEANLAQSNISITTGSSGDQDGNITVQSQIDWAGPTTLSFDAAGDVILNAGINNAAGGFEINAGGTITTGPAGTVDIGTFELANGAWTQLGAILPTFNANDFSIADNVDTSFLRALGGSGTQSSPYQLTDVFGLQSVASFALLDQGFALANDIDASATENWNKGEGFVAIEGLGLTPFSGTFDGQGHTITELTSIGVNAALFARTNGADIRNVALDDVNIAGFDIAGGLVGTAIDTTIQNVAVSGIVASEFGTLVGGIVGDLRGASGSLDNSSFTGTVTADNENDANLTIGGLVGRNLSSTVSNSAFTGDITETGFTLGLRTVGGAVGVNAGEVRSVTTSGALSADGAGGTLFAGGLVGDNQSIEGIDASSAAMSVSVTTSQDDAIYAGGLVGNNIGSVTGSQATGDVVIAAADGMLSVGGLIGYNGNTEVRPVSDVRASGNIRVAASALAEAGQPAQVGGLVGTNFGPISDAVASGDVTVTSGLVNSYVGGFVGYNGPVTDGGGPGEITASVASGSVNYTTDLEGAVGGFAGANDGTIADAFAEGTTTLSMSAFRGDPFDTDYGSAVGGFTGANAGSQTRTAARGDVSGQTVTVPLAVGGHSGAQLFGATRDAYASGDVVANSTGQSTVGGLFGGINSGTLTNSYSSGEVSETGSGPAFVGGLIGLNLEGAVAASFWDVTTSGQADPGDIRRGEGLSTAELEDTAGFVLRAGAAGWDFAGVWAPGASGRYASIYTIDRVVFATPGLLELTYGQTVGATATGAINGGPGSYVFADPEETLNTAPIFESLTFADETVGTRAFTLNTAPLISSFDQTYAVVGAPGFAEISAALLQLSVNDAAKTYGQTLNFDGTEFTVTGGQLFFGDSVDTIAISSVGALDTAQAVGSPYVISGGAPATGTGTENYEITVLDGALTVDRAPLEITVDDASKTYGQALTFDGTEFSVTSGELFFADGIDPISISSTGAAADAEVADSPYAIIAGASVTGTRLENYDIALVDGALTIDTAPLELTLNDATTTYGTPLSFDGTEFALTGGTLFFADSIDTIDIATVAAGEETAGVQSRITSDGIATGTRAGNYALTVLDGALTVERALLELAVNNATKTYGETLEFAGTEFSVTGGTLFYGDSVETIVIASDGAAADAGVSGAPYNITGAAPLIGTGADNYEVTVLDGALTIDRAALELTVNDATKTYGQTLNFSGTEFSVTGGSLFSEDSVGTLTITSAGAVAEAEVAGSAYVISGEDPTGGTGSDNYDITVLDGALTVSRAALTVIPDDLTKAEGDTLVFNGTEFATRGLLLEDTVDRVTLASDGANAEAEQQAYDITASGPTGARVANYDVTFETGTLTVVEPQLEPIFTPDVPPQIELPNPNDRLVLLIPGLDDTGFAGGGASSGPALSQARETLALVQEISTTLEIAAASCNESSGNVNRYLACLSDALDDFADELDAISTDLPPGMENVARIVRDARQQVNRAQVRAQTRLAGAVSQTERDQIARDAVGEARVALNSAATEIRKAISFVRADDPELASVQRATITTVAAAIDGVAIELSRATGL